MRHNILPGGIVKCCFVTTFMLLASASVHATDTLTCNGDTYSLDMSVGSDNMVNSVTLRDGSTKTASTYRLAGIENRQLIWAANEGDFSANRLAIVLKDNDGQSFVVEARGRQGVLRHRHETHTLDCDWER